MILIEKIIEESNLLQDCVLALVICVNKIQDTLNPICSCDFDVESTSHFILHCSMMKNIPS